MTAGVKITVQDSSGTVLGIFMAEEGKTIAQMAEEHNIDIPISCGAWACFVCAVKVIKGKEFMHQNMISSPLIDLEENQFLTCIGGVKSEHIHGNELKEIILEKIL